MTAGSPGDTVLLPRAAAHRPLTSTGLRTTALAPELMTQSVRRLRVLTLLYEFTFFMAGLFPNLVIAENRAHFFGAAAHAGLPRPKQAGRLIGIKKK